MAKPLNGACSRCHAKKMKCHFDMPGTVCASCHRLGEACFPRKRQRMGRQPRVKKYPSGNSSIMRFESTSQYDWERQSSSDCDKLSTPPACFPRSSASQDLGWMVNKRSTTFMSDKGMQLATSIVRTPEPPGAAYRQVYNILANKDSFYELHRQFMLGREYADEFQAAVLVLFNRSPHILSPAYYAVLGLAAFRNICSRGLHGFDWSRGADCIRCLRQASLFIADVEDAAVFLMLGQLLLVYNHLVPSFCEQAIECGALLSAKDWYPALVLRPELDSVTLCLVLVDTVKCLIGRELPVMRLTAVDRCTFDRFIGACSSFLPLLYDLCERSYQVKMGIIPKGCEQENLEASDPYKDIERKISAWKPLPHEPRSSQHEVLETDAALAQASLYRIAALLVIHRLRFPIGKEDSTARRYADCILTQLSFISTCSSEGTGIGLDFPLLVAMMELPNRGEQLFWALDNFRIQKNFSNIAQFVKSVWKEYDSGYNGLWLDLIPRKLQLPMLP